LSQSISDEFEFRGAEGANSANKVEKRCTGIDILIKHLLLLLVCLVCEELVGLSYVFDEVGNQIDFAVVLNN